MSVDLAASDPRAPEGGDPASFEVVVIGAGQAGLAMGALLARRGVRFVILEAAGAVGPAWRGRWDSLVLFTPARVSGLPGLPFPGDPDAYPTRDEVVAYLERYAEHLDLPIVFDRAVDSLSQRADGRYAVVSGDLVHAADQVVVATGPFAVPSTPALAADLAPEVFQTHSAGYRNPEGLPDGPVLVVGGGNTGFQIAEELSATREVHLSIGSRQTPLPQRLLGRDVFWWLTRLGLMSKDGGSRIGRRMKARDPVLIGSSPRRLARGGVRLRPRAVEASGRRVAFADGTDLEVGAVIWATGFRRDHSWIDAPRHGEQGIRHRRGVAVDSAGLYFLGLPWQHSRGSALIGWVAEDAEFIAEQISARRQVRPAAA